MFSNLALTFYLQAFIQEIRKVYEGAKDKADTGKNNISNSPQIFGDIPSFIFIKAVKNQIKEKQKDSRFIEENQHPAVCAAGGKAK